MDEYRIVLNRTKLKIPVEVRNHYLELFSKNSINSESAIYTKFNRDRKDAKFVNLALHNCAAYIISLDNHLLKADILNGIKCITPEQFSNIFAID